MKISKNILFVIIVATIAITSSLIYWHFFVKELIFLSDQAIEETSLTQQSSVTSTTPTPIVLGLKTYHNDEFGFNFQYPEDWTFHENIFGGPFTKFNLVGASPEENGLPNPLAPSVLINIVTPDFADRAVLSRHNIGAIESDFIVDDIPAKKYEYSSNFPKISVDLPFREFRMILAASIEYKDAFSQILRTFKILK